MTGMPGKHGQLAPFAEDWVGGDIGGLHALATALYDFVPEITGVTAALNERSSRLTGGDEGWAQALAAVIGEAAGIIGCLAAELAVIENALEEQAQPEIRRPSLSLAVAQATTGSSRCRPSRWACPPTGG